MSEIIIGIRNGLKRGLRSLSTKPFTCSKKVSIPPIPEPQTTPILSRFSFSKSNPESAMASSATTTPNCVNRSIRRASLRSRTSLGSKSLTSHAKCVLNKEASNLVIGPAPDLPASRFFQVSSAELPSGVSAPKPVTTTRLRLINKTLVYPFASSIYEIA